MHVVLLVCHILHRAPPRHFFLPATIAKVEQTMNIDHRACSRGARARASAQHASVACRGQVLKIPQPGSKEEARRVRRVWHEEGDE